MTSYTNISYYLISAGFVTVTFFLRFRFLSVESGLKYLNYRNYLIPLMDQWRMVLILYLFFPD